MKFTRRKKIKNIFRFCLPLLLLASQFTGGNAQTKSVSARDNRATQSDCLPTGVCLDAAGRSFAVGNMPLAMILSPEGYCLVVSLSGWREQGLQIVERASGRILQKLTQPSAFLGLAFSPDGRTLYASGGNEDATYVYSWRDEQAALIDKIILAEKKPDADGTRFSAGIAVSNDGKKLYVAENLADTLAVVDIETRKIEQRLPTESYPYDVKISPDEKIFVSAWGGATVSVFSKNGDGSLKENRKISVGRHPSALLLNKNGSRLFVASAITNRIAVVDAKSETVVANLMDAPPSKNEGATPNALALSNDETLY